MPRGQPQQGLWHAELAHASGRAVVEDLKGGVAQVVGVDRLDDESGDVLAAHIPGQLVVDAELQLRGAERRFVGEAAWTDDRVAQIRLLQVGVELADSHLAVELHGDHLIALHEVQEAVHAAVGLAGHRRRDEHEARHSFGNAGLGRLARAITVHGLGVAAGTVLGVAALAGGEDHGVAALGSGSEGGEVRGVGGNWHDAVHPNEALRNGAGSAAGLDDVALAGGVHGGQGARGAAGADDEDGLVGLRWHHDGCCLLAAGC
eukprot:scaffold895_cov315-Pinguiococcus_pyrenoidosus.AAC.74